MKTSKIVRVAVVSDEFEVQTQDSASVGVTLEEKVPVPPVEEYCVQIAVKCATFDKLPFTTYSLITKLSAQDRVGAGQCVAGYIQAVGSKCSRFKVGQRVVGLVSLLNAHSACADFCVTEEFNIVALDDNVGFKEAVSSLLPGLRAYISLHYLGRAERGDSLLLPAPLCPAGWLGLQLAAAWGLKVFCAVYSAADRNAMKELETATCDVIDLSHKSSSLLTSIKEETAGVGVDVVIDNGVRQFDTDENSRLPWKHEVLGCLSVGGRWVTGQTQLQLDPPDCQQLTHRGATVSFLNEHAWLLSGAKQGKVQHILHDLVSRLEQRTLRPRVPACVTMDTAPEQLRDPPDAVVIEM